VKNPLLPLVISLGWLATLAAAQAVPSAVPGNEAIPPSISLSPAVVMARGSFGQALTQTLTMTNQTGAEMSFVMEAYDEVIRDGKRAFVPAGELEHSVAATAVFSQKTVFVKPHSSASVDVHLTLPAETRIRAISAMFRGTNLLPSRNAVGMTASLATLITFNLTNDVKLEAEPIRVTPATDTSNLNAALWMTNTGSEPLVPEGVAAVLDATGKLAAKANFPGLRLLPGEKLDFAAEFPEQIRPGSYKVLCSFQFEGKTLTTESAFTVK
jgi:hypothetical protein